MGESVARNFDLVSAGVEHSAAYRLQNRDLTNLLASGLGEEEPCLLVSRPTALVKDFLKRSGSRRAGDRLAQRLAWGWAAWPLSPRWLPWQGARACWWPPGRWPAPCAWGRRCVPR